MMKTDNPFKGNMMKTETERFTSTMRSGSLVDLQHQSPKSKINHQGLTFKKQLGRNFSNSRKSSLETTEVKPALQQKEWEAHSSARKKEVVNHAIDFSKTLPRNMFIKMKQGKSKIYQAYTINFNSIDKKSDKLCLPFGKCIGRPDSTAPINSSSRLGLGKQLNLLSKVQREGDLYRPKNANQNKAMNVSQSEYSSRQNKNNPIVPMDKTLPRCKNPKSDLPSWMQKEASYNRMGVTFFGEKSIEFNSYRTGKIRSYNTLDLKNEKMRANKKYEIKLEDISSEDLGEDLPTFGV